jgi:predicted O-linked N-acetylglucosamine transferase (SPINDLY family)
LTTQSLFKLLPQYDSAYVDLLEAVPNGVLVFLGLASKGVIQAFWERIAHAARARGLDPEDRIRVVPGQPWERFLALNHVCHVFLDAPGWSGGMTTFDALSQGLIPVTRPGPQMRQRHTGAILGALGLQELIAPDLGTWVATAARVATDSAWRAALQAEVARELPRLYRDPTPIRALEALLIDRLGG